MPHTLFAQESCPSEWCHPGGRRTLQLSVGYSAIVFDIYASCGFGVAFDLILGAYQYNITPARNNDSDIISACVG